MRIGMRIGNAVSPLELVQYAGAIVVLALALLVLFIVGWFITDTIRGKRP